MSAIPGPDTCLLLPPTPQAWLSGPAVAWPCLAPCVPALVPLISAFRLPKVALQAPDPSSFVSASSQPCSSKGM